MSSSQPHRPAPPNATPSAATLPSKAPGPRGEKLTPVMRQYHDAKARQPDAILLFRMGDFYEMFYDDAITAARVLELTLTSRNKGDPDQVPMAGVPYHAVDGYIARLVDAGFKVAICEQMADPATVRGIVPRQVVRVITPGLVTNEDQLEAGSNNYLCAIEASGLRFGIAVIDISTGELKAGETLDEDGTLTEVARLEPKEILLGTAHEHDEDARSEALASLRRSLEKRGYGARLRQDPPIDLSEATQVLGQVLSEEQTSATLQRFADHCVCACARVLRLAIACNPSRNLPVARVAHLDPSTRLQIDEIAQAHLELVRAADGSKRGTLLSVLDRTLTGPGARLLKQWLLSPLMDVRRIQQRQDAVQGFVADAASRGKLRGALGQMADLERLAARVQLGDASPKDLGALRDTLQAAPQALQVVRQMEHAAVYLPDEDPLAPLQSLTQTLTDALVDRPPPTARDGGIVRDGFDKELDESRELQRKGADHIIALEAQLRADTGIPTLKIRFTRVFGWYVEVSKSNVSKVPATWRRKQTVATGERFTNDTLDDLADRLLHAEERQTQREAALLAQLHAMTAQSAEQIARLGRLLAKWDVFASLAEVAHVHDYCRPVVDDGDMIDIRQGRHPVVEQLAAKGGFVPNDVRLDAHQQRFWLITGPNMAGKSTLMRQVAHIVLLAQMGSFVPAQEATLGLVDRILSRVGASDNVTRGESTFMVEMRETASILRQATARSLVILDEIGRGTSTYDGLAIAWAVAEHLHDVVRCRTMFATHYHELTEFAQGARHADNFSVAAKELGEDVVFLYRIMPGAASRSYGIAVAKLAGVGEAVLVRARAILHGLEAGAQLPGGRYATLRARTDEGQVQLDLFGQEPAVAKKAGRKAEGKVERKALHPVLETLKQVNADQMTPLEALQLVVKMQAMVQEGARR